MFLIFGKINDIVVYLEFFPDKSIKMYIFVKVSQNNFNPKMLLKVAKKSILFVKKGDYEPQYFTLRTIKNLGVLRLQNVLNI